MIDMVSKKKFYFANHQRNLLWLYSYNASISTAKAANKFKYILARFKTKKVLVLASFCNEYDSIKI
ncbi:hypothetical protein CXP39_02850 [Mesoplasma syrphidae]|uniref:Uncharacterized protein n=1 Tax=Mesoplasma syrphidae TaxID=225999 RepID=A0A2K9BNV6_9MOLU|nr:hypothetical protein CXP39_02850 [Mesoplasma syrphidae]